MKKIPVSAPQAPLQSPFARLDPAAFPEAPEGTASPSASKPREPRRHRVVLRRETSQRGGKTVIVISALPSHWVPEELEALLKKAKRALGCGGTRAGRELELQGDQPGRVRAFLEGEGFEVAGPG